MRRSERIGGVRADMAPLSSHWRESDAGGQRGSDTRSLPAGMARVAPAARCGGGRRGTGGGRRLPTARTRLGDADRRDLEGRRSSSAGSRLRGGGQCVLTIHRRDSCPVLG